MNFSTFNLHPNILQGVRACGFEQPTPIQRQTVPKILAGHDMMGLAQTGTGKTAAFVLPILQRLIQGPRGRVRALIVAPTRELAEQIHAAINTLGRYTRIGSVTVYGGASKQQQLKKIRAGAEIIVACPGRLLDHLQDGTINLRTVECLVLDEADHMFDMGFLPPIRRIIKALPATKQTLLFSATMPQEIRHLAEDILNNPVRVQIAHGRPAATVTQKVYAVEQDRKTALLHTLLAGPDFGPTLVFTRTKYRAMSLARKLQKYGYAATSLQGNLSQNKRQQALAGFKRGEYTILVATDIAARGIDVHTISHVINFDVPDTVEAYTHRIGRTGRADRAGAALTFAGRSDKKIIGAIEQNLGARLKRLELPALAALPAGRKGKEKSPAADGDDPQPQNRTAQKVRGRRRPQASPAAGRSGTGKKEATGKRARYQKTGQRQKRRSRAAVLAAGDGHLFL